MLGKSKTASANASSKKAPISSHPLFAVVVAVWFAALLGVGSVILPVALFEGLFSATGISSVVPAAAPPLGFTARMLIAVGAATCGAIAGVVVARKVAASQNTASGRNLNANANYEDDHEHAAGEGHSSKRPISAHEELGSDSLDEPIAEPTAANFSEISEEVVSGRIYKGKRRSLAVTDESGPSEFLDLAPLPGGEVEFNEGDPMHHAGPLELGEFSDEHNEVDDGGDDADLHGPFSRNPISNSPQSVDFGALDDDEGFRPAENASAPSQKFAAQSTFTPPEDLHEESASMSDAASQTPGEAYNPFADKQPVGDNFAKPFAADQAQVKFAEPLSQITPARELAAPEAHEGSAPMPQAFAAPSQSETPLSELAIVELVERFTKALQSKSSVSPVALASSAAEVSAAVEPPPAPVVPAPVVEAIVEAVQPPLENEATASDGPSSPLIFRRANSAAPDMEPALAPEPEFAPAAAVPALAQAMDASTSVPAALQPLGFDDVDDEDETSDFAGLALSLQNNALAEATVSTEPEAQAAQFSAPFAEPPTVFDAASVPGAAQELGAEQPAEEDNYSSLLNMRSAMASSREFVRIEDDDSAAPKVEPVVVFPGQESQVAAPMVNEPSYPEAHERVGRRLDEDTQVHRPFDGPSGTPVAAPSNAFSNSGDTERALREALEKLQRMSGAA